MRIGLLANFTDKWIGGMYYIRNIILALNSLPNHLKPEIVLFHHIETPTELFDSIEYPKYKKVCLQSMPIWKRGMLKIVRILTNRNYQIQLVLDSEKVDSIFPLIKYYDDLKTKTPLIYWIFDFQHKFLPEYFSKEEKENRDDEFEKMTISAEKIIVSSENAKSHLLSFYPNTKANIGVLKFKSIIDFESLKKQNISEVKSKYGISDKPYFMVSNQFWKHKNHMVVLKALKEMQNPPFQIIFTGLEEDTRDKDYVPSIRRFIAENKLENKFRSLGFISRVDQLLLLLHSIAGIQPSKFEGWNTSIEDAKTLGVKMIVSNLEVHKEQLGEKGVYFRPDQYQELVKILSEQYVDYKKLPPKEIDFFKLEAKLEKDQQEFAENFLSLLK